MGRTDVNKSNIRYGQPCFWYRTATLNAERDFFVSFRRSCWSSTQQEEQGRREINSRCLSEIVSGKKAGFSNNHSIVPPFLVVNLFPFYAGAPEVASRWSSGIAFCCWCYHQSPMVPNKFVAWRSLVYFILFQLFMLKASCSVSTCILCLWMWGYEWMHGGLLCAYNLDTNISVFNKTSTNSHECVKKSRRYVFTYPLYK